MTYNKVKNSSSRRIFFAPRRKLPCRWHCD